MPNQYTPRLTLSERFWSKVDKRDSCWLWTGGKDRHGYGHVWDADRRVMRTASRVSYELAYGPLPVGSCVLHRCDTPSCVNPAHLFLGTQADNARDMVRKGRHYSPYREQPQLAKRGDGHPAAKLTAVKVRAIRGEYAAGGVSYGALAHRWGVSYWVIRNVVKRRDWRHIE